MTSNSRWLDVEVGTDDTELNTLPCNLALVDLQNDEEYKLLVGDFGRGDDGPKLKVFRGAMQIADSVLGDLPLGIEGFYPNDSIPKPQPIIAVALSSCICFFRNLKLFYKHYLPAFKLSSGEIDIWKQLTNATNHNPASITTLTESLKAMPPKILSEKSHNFISMTPDQQLEYLEQAPEVSSKNVPEITCMTTLKLSSVDRYAASCLVVGTEEGTVYFLEPQTFSTLAQVKLSLTKNTPYQMVATGLYNVDFRITIATREKSVCVIKRDWREGRVLFSTDEHIIAIDVMPADNTVLVISADHTLACYSRKGKKQWSLSMEHRPISLCLVPIMHLGVTLIAVSLASGHLHLFDGKVKRDTIFVRDVASIIKFGQLGLEEHVFVIITASGNLMLKILKRTAEFNADAAGIETGGYVNPAQKPWLIPKKSKLFIEQSVRERENATAMHESFQHELSRLRLTAAKALLDAHMRSDNCIGVGDFEPVRLSAEVEGLGPVFRVTLAVENTSTDKPVVGLVILFHVHNTNYKVYNPYIKVPLLAPTSKLKFPTKIEELFQENINPDIFFRSVTGQGGEGSTVKVLLLRPGQSRPALAAAVTMPPTDPLMLPFDKIDATGDFGVTNLAGDFGS